MEEIIYIAPNGREATEEELVAKYGDKFQDLVANGTFKKKNEVPTFTESKSEESPSGFMSYLQRPKLPRSSYLKRDPNNPNEVTFVVPTAKEIRKGRVRENYILNKDILL